MTEKAGSGGRKMWQGWYGTEPFDLRLAVLRLFRQLPVILAATLLGMLVFGGGYYGKNILFRGPGKYAVTSVFRVDYAVADPADVADVYINAASWNTYLHSGMFLGMVQSRLEGNVPEQELSESLEAVMWSDLRVPGIIVTTEEAGKSERIARAVEEVMTQNLTLPEVAGISVIDKGAAEEVVPDVRVGRALILSALLSCFFAVVILMLKETGDDSIWLPGSLWKRYGLKAVGTPESRELAANLGYLFSERKQPGRESVGTKRKELPNGKKPSAKREEPEVWQSGQYQPETGKEEQPREKPRKGEQPREKPGKEEQPHEESGKGGLPAGGTKTALCMVQEGMDPEAVLGRLREKCPDVVDDTWFAVASPLKAPDVGNLLRKADGILLAVKAGSHAGGQLEYVLEYLALQDCEARAAVLWDADEKLLRWYYFGRSGAKGREDRG